MKAVKIIVILLLVYVGVVVLFESLLGYMQPADQHTLVITTTDADGKEASRVLRRLEIDGELFVAVNHWPRNWYRRALANPLVHIASEYEEGLYYAVELTGADYDRVDQTFARGLGFKLLTGFPPRRMFKLEPQPVDSE